MKDILDLRGRVALITGAGQGVGRQVALHFAVHGAQTVLVNDYHEERSSAVVEEIESMGGHALSVVGDITDYDAITDSLHRALGQVGALHIVVNNAGNAGPTGSLDHLPPFWETGPHDWQHWMDTNLYGVLNVCRATIPAIIESKSGGSIINVISDAARTGDAALAVYSAAKAGSAGFARSMARALGAHQIRVNSVSLAAINTPGVQPMLADPLAVKLILKQYMIRRLGEPSDVANMILFLASDASQWITGQTFPVNGGFSVSH
jgi:2-hydroxycyclohexanecarboxyl-CoA dehydrogenase